MVVLRNFLAHVLALQTFSLTRTGSRGSKANCKAIRSITSRFTEIATLLRLPQLHFPWPTTREMETLLGIFHSK